MIVSILRQRIQIDNSYFTISLFKSLNFLKFKSSYIVFVLRFLFVKFAWKVKRESENFFSSFLSSKRLSHMMGTAWLTSFISGVSVCEISVSFFCGFRYFTFFTFPFNFNCSHDNKGQFPSFSGGSIAEMICVVIKTNIKQFWSTGGGRWVFLKRVSLEALKMQYCCLNSAPQKLSPNFTVVKDIFQH